MKKFGAALIILMLSVSAGISAYAEITSNEISVIIDNMWVANQIADDAYFDLYSSGSEYLGTEKCEVITNTKSAVTFNVPQYYPGQEFILRLNYGYSLLQHYDNVITDGGSFVLSTYAYSDGNGQTVMNDKFYMTGVPYSSRINFLVYNSRADMDIKLFRGIPAAPADMLFDALGIAYKWDAYGLTAAYNGTTLTMTIDSNIVSVNGYPVEMDIDMTYADGGFYIPVGFVMSVFGIPVTADEYNGSMNINAIPARKQIEKSAEIYEQAVLPAAVQAAPSSAENYVNSAGVSSRTDYLIWISKSDYKLYVFLGSAGNWQLCRTFDCAVGKASSPTVTGQFEYYSRESRWTYANYYVGPIMRFKGGYAIHSTLLSYDGSDYDARVGMKLSHGCVRVRKPDIDWLVSYVPLYTKIYITE